MGMTTRTTDVSVDDVLTMLALICAKLKPYKIEEMEETLKDSIALILEDESPFDVDSLYEQVLERRKALEGAV